MPAPPDQRGSDFHSLTPKALREEYQGKGVLRWAPQRKLGCCRRAGAGRQEAASSC